ncbi:hypothetical protein EJ05DRAFT_99045 [Pseudovirgaria hyperparasitica]|uniref:C2H2-type domain-containing protein n=1 Tax=Pseudovirgaria hyperparasitica TaxID=470096 RepID=A0A6A6VXF2_9PEZI|nr:uncharacterized protein EJ05DRAFT_99045 [Pseudovirgaria hyperparasitica]KAF2755348.1 hypothetical protein EJ05DRAFT_99045 [Pseudovirgaria hyperparasitica]
MGGKKRKNFPTVEDELGKPWCYYCERDFTDMLNLIRHQKAKHFKCERCGRRLNTAGGLSVHMNQVHKEQLHFVENALENRKGLEVEIFGMEGIPDDIKQAHQQRVLQNFYQAEADRRQNTGNPPPGQGGPQKEPRRKPTVEELKKRLAEHRVKRANAPVSAPPASNSPGVPGQFQYGQPQSQQPYGQPQFGGAPSVQYPGAPFNGQGPPASLPAPPPGVRVVSNPPDGSGPGTSIDDLIADAARKATVAKALADDPERKPKKDTKAIKLIYSDNETSPEEKRAMLPRYAFSRA